MGGSCTAEEAATAASSEALQCAAEGLRTPPRCSFSVQREFACLEEPASPSATLLGAASSLPEAPLTSPPSAALQSFRRAAGCLFIDASHLEFVERVGMGAQHVSKVLELQVRLSIALWIRLCILWMRRLQVSARYQPLLLFLHNSLRRAPVCPLSCHSCMPSTSFICRKLA